MLADSASDAAAAGAGLATLLLVVVGALLYFLPTVVAAARKCRNTGPVLIINFFLGWTFIGWIVALAMAFGQTRNDPLATQVVQVYSHAPGAPATSGPTMSPDGRYWWDGAAWRDTTSSAPPSAPRSADGLYWWDGGRWRAVPAGNFA